MSEQGGWQGLPTIAKWFVAYNLVGSVFGAVMAILVMSSGHGYGLVLGIVLIPVSYYPYWCARIIWRDHNRLGAKITFILNLCALGLSIVVVVVTSGTPHPVRTSVLDWLAAFLGTWFSYATMRSLPQHNSRVSGQIKEQEWRIDERRPNVFPFG